MPNRNQMGPLGAGPKTGRGLGLCGRNASQGESGQAKGKIGRGWCGGQGQGQGRGGRGQGGGGRNRGRGFATWATAVAETMPASSALLVTNEQPALVNSEANRQDLMRQADWLREQLRQIEVRLNVAGKE